VVLLVVGPHFLPASNSEMLALDSISFSDVGSGRAISRKNTIFVVPLVFLHSFACTAYAHYIPDTLLWLQRYCVSYAINKK
jgi:hypothetical protein